MKRRVASTVSFFLFQIFEKRFTYSIVKRISFLGKRLNNIKGVQKTTESKSGILSSTVRVKHQTLGSAAGGISFTESSDRKVHILFGRQVPSNDLAGKKVNDNAKIIPFSASPQISNITHPNKIRGILSKALAETVGTKAVIGTTEIMSGVSSRHFW